MAALLPLLVAATCATPAKPIPTVAARHSPSPRPAPTPSPVPLATDGWMLSAPGYDTEGYASTTSAAPGDTVTLYVSSRASSWWADIYRLGWYAGLGGGLVASLPAQVGVDQGGHTPVDPATGLIRAAWKPSLAFQVGADWTSGMYMIKLSDSSGQQGYVPLVVRGEGRAPVLFIHSSFTDEAYNLWAGESLYAGGTPSLHIGRAVEVSLDRPFNQDYGAGDFFFWEYQMVRFLERNGITADYATDADIDQHPELLRKYKAVIITGHDEYWSPSMRDGYQRAVQAGVSLAVFAANTAYRPIRLQPSDVGQDRVIVAYKDATLDPQHTTGVNWRGAPWGWDEQSLLGVHYISTGNIRPLPWIVSDAGSWVFARTGLTNGEALPGLLGYEQDQFAAGSPHPAGVDVLTSSPVTTTSGQAVRSNASVYVASSGAVVFSTGSIQWSWGLDSFRTPSLVPGLRQTFVTDRRPDYVSKAAQTIALNVLHRMLGSSFPSPTTVPGEPVPAPSPSPPPVTPIPETPAPPDEG